MREDYSLVGINLAGWTYQEAINPGAVGVNCIEGEEETASHRGYSSVALQD